MKKIRNGLNENVSKKRDIKKIILLVNEKICNVKIKGILKHATK